jgi:hypothetical protein
MPDFTEAVTSKHVVICEVCKKRDETRVIEERATNRFALQREHEDDLRARGWRLFISRSRRWYCPNHGPKPGHRMHEVTR